MFTKQGVVNSKEQEKEKNPPPPIGHLLWANPLPATHRKERLRERTVRWPFWPIVFADDRKKRLLLKKMAGNSRLHIV
jgi:hypothetical protein